MKGFGRMLAGYLVAVVFAAVAMVVVTRLWGPDQQADSFNRAAFSGQVVGFGLAAFAPVYLVYRVGLAILRQRSMLAFVCAFSVSFMIFGSIAQVPDIWLVDWHAEKEVVSDTIANLILHQRLGRGFELGPLVFTQVTLGFWSLVGAAFGLIIWSSEQIKSGASGAGSRKRSGESE